MEAYLEAGLFVNDVREKLRFKVSLAEKKGSLSQWCQQFYGQQFHGLNKQKNQISH